MTLLLNPDTKTIDVTEGGEVILQLSFAEAARRGVPFTRDPDDYNTIIFGDISNVSARIEGDKVIITLDGDDLTELMVG